MMKIIFSSLRIQFRSFEMEHWWIWCDKTLLPQDHYYTGDRWSVSGEAVGAEQEGHNGEIQHSL